ncbi:FUSC family protein [Siccirubricoccus sp. KC 17139]|uniref:FUSC family protein n=1 Tax=Siccirubricoccus soli TaxID=2899147 RepID=A0ABT1D7T8_9PROT|nr:FUSC family protein [Siccirubricoccus soli]MCO6417325.1 FUSC family protein [Siccirubricoccus soli]MCP2683460.1 FUSC family protein [Siccirubricoccus soli]
MTWPSWRDWLFSLKAFAAAMLALYIALACGLPRPYWAMTAVYVVANPLSGATVSKAFDRAFGTLLGAAGGVLLVSLFNGAPELLMLAIALWTGSFLYIALHGRTPRNYVFMLAGYTLPLLVLPGVDAPETIFELAVARSEEIILGILAAAIIGTTIFPRSLRSVVDGRIGAWLGDAGGWAREILLARGADPAAPVARQRLAADIAPLSALISQLSHDAGTRDIKPHVLELRGRFLFLLPLLSALADRMHALRLELGAFPPGLQALTERIAAWIGTPVEAADAAEPDRLRAGLAALPGPADGPLWTKLVWTSLVSRLSELIDLWEDCLTLRGRIGRQGAPQRWRPQLRHRPVVGEELHHDRGRMALAVASTVLATFLAGLLWIWSGWADGANAVAFVAIACCFFGGLDRPAPSMKFMLVWSAIAYAFTSLYLFVVLPRIQDFELLVLVLAPPFLLVGALIPRPELSLLTLLLAVNLAGDLGLQGRYSAEFASYTEGGIAIMAGLLFALVWTLVTRPFGEEWAARRLMRSGWADLAALASGARPFDHRALVSRTLDRLGQLMPRLAAMASPSPAALEGLAELRAGYNIIALQRDRRALPPEARAAIDATLRGVADFFGRCAADGERGAAPEALRGDIDRALRAVFALEEAGPRQAALDALVGLRRSLFPGVPGPAGPGFRHRDGDRPALASLAAE